MIYQRHANPQVVIMPILHQRTIVPSCHRAIVHPEIDSGLP